MRSPRAANAATLTASSSSERDESQSSDIAEIHPRRPHDRRGIRRTIEHTTVTVADGSSRPGRTSSRRRRAGARKGADAWRSSWRRSSPRRWRQAGPEHAEQEPAERRAEALRRRRRRHDGAAGGCHREPGHSYEGQLTSPRRPMRRSSRPAAPVGIAASSTSTTRDALPPPPWPRPARTRSAGRRGSTRREGDAGAAVVVLFESPDRAAAGRYPLASACRPCSRISLPARPAASQPLEGLTRAVGGSLRGDQGAVHRGEPRRLVAHRGEARSADSNRSASMRNVRLRRGGHAAASTIAVDSLPSPRPT